MAVVLKRSEGAITQECHYGCCGPLVKDGHGKTGKATRRARRIVKARDKKRWKKDVDNQRNDC